jgi:hypothetical protein
VKPRWWPDCGLRSYRSAAYGACSVGTAEVTSSTDHPPSRAYPSRYKAKFLPAPHNHPHDQQSCIGNLLLKLSAQHCVILFDPELPSQLPLEPWPEEILELHVAIVPKLPRYVLIGFLAQRCIHEAGKGQRGLCHPNA